MAKFGATKTAEQRLAIELRKVAKIVGGIVQAHVNGDKIVDKRKLAEALEAYSDALGPWGEAVVEKIMKSVADNNKRAWAQTSTSIAKELRTNLAESAIGAVARQLQREQVELIKSLPLEAGLRAQKLAQEAQMGGKRASEVAAELARTEEVTASRATLIARTEIAKANATITTARAKFVGATHYIWRTAEDADVRDSHAAMEGKIFRFDDPPYVEGEGNHGPGEIYNCRCFAEPIIPEPETD
jgi:SPP1 gp7 family putative phage head morphogenesis protein